jgi:hypothetical protein
MNFYSIEIINNQEKISLKPVNCLKVTDDNNKIVVIYELEYSENNNIKHKAYVNYYLSDGNTNKLRANMLFPFYCYHQRDSKSCIHIDGTYRNNYKLLVKVTDVKNINMDKLNTSILTKTKIQIHEKNKISLETSENIILDYLDLYTTEVYENNPTTNISEFNFTVNAIDGLVSVVQRIENLLDLVIGLYSDPLINIVSFEHYEPIPHIDYTSRGIDYYDFTQSCKTLGVKSNDYVKFEENDIIVDKALRENLVKELNSMINMLTKTKIFNASVVNLEPTDVNKSTFNDTYSNICKNNKINHSKKINYGKYFIISQLLLQMVIKKINTNIQNYNIELCKINKNQSDSIKSTLNRKLYKNKIDMLNEFRSMLLEKTLYLNDELNRNENSLLQKNIETWEGRCN